MAWGFLTTFRWRLELKQKTSGVDKSSGTPTECPSSVFYGRDKNFFDPCRTWGSGTTHRKSTPALRRVQNSPPGTNTMGPAPPPGPICRTVEPDLMQSAHPCDITPLTPWGTKPHAQGRPRSRIQYRFVIYSRDWRFALYVLCGSVSSAQSPPSRPFLLFRLGWERSRRHYWQTAHTLQNRAQTQERAQENRSDRKDWERPWGYYTGLVVAGGDCRWTGGHDGGVATHTRRLDRLLACDSGG